MKTPSCAFRGWSHFQALVGCSTGNGHPVGQDQTHSPGGLTTWKSYSLMDLKMVTVPRTFYFYVSLTHPLSMCMCRLKIIMCYLVICKPLYYPVPETNIIIP